MKTSKFNTHQAKDQRQHLKYESGSVIQQVFLLARKEENNKNLLNHIPFKDKI